MAENNKQKLSFSLPGKKAPEGKGVPVGGQARSLFEPFELTSQGLMPEDLPYASEVEAALARRPDRRVRWLSVAVCVFFFAAVLWAAFAKLDEVTHAEGQVIASSRTQVIQNLEGGILSSVEVQEGQTVEKNELLARLDNENAESVQRDMLYKAMENMTAIHRLRSVVDNKDSLVWPENFQAWLEKGTGYSLTPDQLRQGRELAAVQSETFGVQKRQRHAELHVLEAQYSQRREEVREQSSRRRQLQNALSLIRQQIALAGPLVAKQSYSRANFLEMQERAAKTETEVVALGASIPRAEAAAREAQQRILMRKAEMDSALMDELNKRSLALASLRESLSASTDKVTRTELRSPVRGTVKKIYLNTLGGVAKPGEAVMEIVPLDDTLLVEAKVRPADVAFIHPGQQAKVKISAYDYSIYGGLDGVVEQISADTLEDKRGEQYYQVKVRTPKTAILYRGKELPIMPGMLTTVDILTGEKTVLDYLMKPILKARQNALREK